MMMIIIIIIIMALTRTSITRRIWVSRYLFINLFVKGSMT
jgi:hypothetical protein